MTRRGAGCLLVLGLVYARPVRADGLPARPEQTAEQVAAAIARGECPELALVRGQQAPAPDCDGVILPLSVWAHLEALAVDSRRVRALHGRHVYRSELELAAAKERAAWLAQELDAAQAPPSLADRPAAWIAAGMAAGAGAVVFGAWAISLVGA